jgi:hypothetical protein
MSEITLNGGEITMLKTLGLSGTLVPGKQLAEKMDGMGGAELLDTLTGLMAEGYVLSNKVNVRTMEGLEGAAFRVNPTFSKDLREAVYPSRKEAPKAGRRQRRS